MNITRRPHFFAARVPTRPSSGYGVLVLYIYFTEQTLRRATLLQTLAGPVYIPSYDMPMACRTHNLQEQNHYHRRRLVTVVVTVVTVVTDHGFRCRCCCCHAWKRFQSSAPSLGSVPSLAVNASESSCCCCCAWNLNGGPLDGGALMKLASNLKGGGVGWESTGGEEEVGAPTWGS